MAKTSYNEFSSGTLNDYGQLTEPMMNFEEQTQKARESGNKARNRMPIKSKSLAYNNFREGNDKQGWKLTDGLVWDDELKKRMSATHTAWTGIQRQRPATMKASGTFQDFPLQIAQRSEPGLQSQHAKRRSLLRPGIYDFLRQRINHVPVQQRQAGYIYQHRQQMTKSRLISSKGGSRPSQRIQSGYRKSVGSTAIDRLQLQTVGAMRDRKSV